jgi:uncharacterized delta-60 repeat protein
MKKIQLLTLLLMLLLGAAQAQADGRPDPEFGTKGRVLLPSSPEEGVASALLKDGRAIVAGRKSLLALLPSGRTDTGFGAGGSAFVLVPPGWSGVNVSDLTLDSQGRLLVAGTVFRNEGSGSKALVARYTPDGQPDPGFGTDGFILADFGFPLTPPGNATDLLVDSIALDGSDRIVLSGQRMTGTRLYKGFYIGVYEPFVARLTAAGEEDRSFAGDGAVQMAGYERLGRPFPDAGGGVYFTAVRSSGKTLVHLLANGEPDPGFGKGGGRPLPRGTEDFVPDAAGGLLPYGKVQGSPGRLPNGVLIKRLRADGSLDREFGRNGRATVRVPRMRYGMPAADPRGGILVGLELRQGKKLGKQPRSPAGFGLARLESDGSLDRGFGRHGTVEIPFGRDKQAGLQELTTNGYGALLLGSWCGGSCGRALGLVDLGAD